MIDFDSTYNISRQRIKTAKYMTTTFAYRSTTYLFNGATRLPALAGPIPLFTFYILALLHAAGQVEALPALAGVVGAGASSYENKKSAVYLTFFLVQCMQQKSLFR